MRISVWLGLPILFISASLALADDQSPPAAPRGNCGSRFYPVSAIPTREEGATTVTVAIDETGEVTNVTVYKSSGFEDLDQASVRCINEAWHFKPATLNGKPIASTKLYKINWKFNSSSEQK